MRIGIGTSIVGQQVAGEAPFDPASLFSGGEDGAWYDPSDLSTLAQNSDGTGAVTVGDPVGYMADKSGNGNHATQPTSTARPTLQQTVGGNYYLDFDGIDDRMLYGLTFSTGRWTNCVAFVSQGNNFIVLGNGSNAVPYAIYGLSNSSDIRVVGNTTLNEVYFDNVISTPSTRDDVFDLAQLSNTVFLDITGGNWFAPSFGVYASGGVAGLANQYGFVLIDRQLTSDERNSVQLYFEALLP